MNNFCKFLTPKEYTELPNRVDKRSLQEIQTLAKTNGTCMNCDEHIWRLGACGLCFTCTTGESDASEDYEIGHAY